MKQFLRNSALFALPIFLYFLVEGFLPSTFFNYRPWEGLKVSYADYLGFNFHPDSHVRMKTVGDLCHHMPNAVAKDETWTIDHRGYRNDSVIESPDVLLIGDSFMAGCSLTQDSTLTNLLMSKSNRRLTVYNIATSTFPQFVQLLNAGKLKKPKLLIFSISERNMPLDNTSKGLASVMMNFPRLATFTDKLLRNYSLNFVRARMGREKGKGVQGANHSTMFFLNGKSQHDNLENVGKMTETLRSYRDFCSSQGIQFLFLPMPNKESVYFERVPFDCQPPYLAALDKSLKKNNIECFNTLLLYNNYRKQHAQLLYHLDDTHWNSNGVNLVADSLLSVPVVKQLLK